MQLLKSLNQQNVLLYVPETQNMPRIKSCLSVQGSDITVKMYNLYPLKYVHTYILLSDRLLSCPSEGHKKQNEDYISLMHTTKHAK
jgi:hypothetical protein